MVKEECALRLNLGVWEIPPEAPIRLDIIDSTCSTENSDIFAKELD